MLSDILKEILSDKIELGRVLARENYTHTKTQADLHEQIANLESHKYTNRKIMQNLNKETIAIREEIARHEEIEKA